MNTTTQKFLERFGSFCFSSTSAIAELRKNTCKAVSKHAAISTKANWRNKESRKTAALVAEATKLKAMEKLWRFMPVACAFQARVLHSSWRRANGPANEEIIDYTREWTGERFLG